MLLSVYEVEMERVSSVVEVLERNVRATDSEIRMESGRGSGRRRFILIVV